MAGSDKGARRGRAPSQRQLRVGEEVRHVLAGIFQRGDLHDPELDGISITVSEVSVSPDLRNATVFVMPLGGGRTGDGQSGSGPAGSGQAADVLGGLKRAAPFLRTMLSKQLTLRTVPRLRFLIDTAFETASRIDGMLRAPAVRADLDSAAAPDMEDGPESGLESDPGNREEDGHGAQETR